MGLEGFIDQATIDTLNQRLIEIRLVHFERTTKGSLLLDLIRVFQLKLATRNRDHLFALLTLANNADDPIFDPDYQEPFENIVRRYTTGFLRQGECYGLLKLVGLSEHSRPDRFPSWIPDWTRQPRSMAVGRFVFENLKCAAAGRTNPVACFDSASDVLIINGRSCGSINVMVSAMKSPDDKASQQQYLAQCEVEVRSVQHSPGSQELSEVLWRTLIANDDKMPLSKASAAYTMAFSYRRRLAESLEQPAAFDAVGSGQRATVAEEETDNNISGHTRFDPPRFDSSRFCYKSRFMDLTSHYSFAITNTGYACLVPNTSIAGDIICVFYGCKVPFVIRKSTIRHDNIYQLIGQCYVHGIMNGEVLADEQLVDEEIRLH